MTMDFDRDLTPAEAERFKLIADRVVADGAAMGLEIEPGALALVPAVRLSVITGEPLGDVMEAVKRIPAVQAQVLRQQADIALADRSSDVHRSLSKMSRSQRLTEGRRIDQERLAATRAQPTPLSALDQERLASLLLIKDPATRLAAARGMNLA